MKNIKRRPNIVLFVTDQQRSDTIFSHGRSDARTPHLDRLANDGVSFTRAFCTAPMCGPARTSLLSGLFPHTHGMVANRQERPGCNRIALSPEVRLLADYLGEAGYATAYTGKWHLGTGSDRRGFKDFLVRFGQGSGDVDTPNGNDYENFVRKLGSELTGKKTGHEADPDFYDARIKCGPSRFGLAEHVASYACDRAVEFIRSRDSGGDDRPFVLVYSCQEPHAPFTCPEPFFSMIDPESLDLPASVRDASGRRWLDRPDWQLTSTEPFSEGDLRKMWSAYLGTVGFIDYLVGRITAALVDTGVMDNTVFIFTSDHGEMLGSHGLLLKGASFYEELVRIPLIVRAPGGSAGETRDALVSHADLVPTILDYARVAPPPSLQGENLRSLLEGGGTDIREGIAAEFHSTNWTDPLAPLRMWRTKHWKYVESLAGEHDHELYDLVNDPGEMNNLAGEASHRGTLAQLARDLHAWCRATGDRWPEVPLPSPEDRQHRKAGLL